MSDFTIKTNAKTRESLVSIGRLTKATTAAIAQGFQDLGSNLVRTGENQALNEPKFGKTYRIKQDGVVKLHRASAPKQSPALLSGNYFEKFDYNAIGAKELEFGNDAEYANFLEEGTDKMKPRPGVLNSVNATVRNARVYFDAAIEKALDLES